MKSLFVLTLAFFITLTLTAETYAQSSDTTPPQLIEFSFTPNSIDTSNSSKSVTFTARATDNISGVRYVILYFQSPSGKQLSGSANLISGNAFDGVYQGTVVFPRYSETGTYNVYAVNLVDEVLNSRFVYQNELNSRGFPTVLQVSGTQDVAPPQLISFNFNPTSINTSNSSQSITFTVRATDDVSGTRYVILYIQSPSGKQLSGSANLISGNAFDGVYQGTVTFPRYSEAGTYKVYAVNLVDEVLNSKFFYQDYLASQGFPTMLQVSSTQDVTPPQLLDFTFSPTSINTSNSSQSVTFNARVTDDISGTRYVILYFQSPSGKQLSGSANLISGNAFDGVYQGTVIFPQYSETGTYNIYAVNLVDEVLNSQFIYQNELASRGYPTTLNVISAPTAASVKIGGRILNANGRGINKATVILTNSEGESRLVITNPFGYYRFNDVSVGSTYVLTVNAKKYTFSPKVFAVNNEETELNLAANP